MTSLGTDFALAMGALRRALLMARLDGQKPNTSAVVIGALIFALVAAGLFLAFRPVAEPTGDANEVEAIVSDDSETAPTPANTDNSQSPRDDGLAPILTPLPTATRPPTPSAQPTATGQPTVQPTVGADGQPTRGAASVVPTPAATPLDLSDAPPPPLPPPPPIPAPPGVN